MLMLNQLTGFGASRSGISSVVFTDSPVLTTDTSIYTFTAAAIGTAAADRMVVVGVSALNSTASRTITDMTIGGITVTAGKSFSDTTSGANRAGAGVYAAMVPTGTTADVVVTFSGTQVRCALDVWAVYGASSTTAVEASSDGNATSSQSVSINSEAIGDVVIAEAISTTSTRTFTWDSPMNEDSDEVIEGLSTHSGASALLAALISAVTVTESGATTPGHLAVAVYR